MSTSGQGVTSRGCDSSGPSHRTPVMVERIVEEAEDVLSLVLADPDGGDLAPAQPGAHVDLIFGKDFARPYSVWSQLSQPRRWCVAVLREPDGRGGSEWVHTRVRAGDRLEVRGPRNNFPLVDAEEYLFIAGGIGITPLLPMIEQLAARDARWRLLYGGRRRGSMAFLDRLRAFGDAVDVRPQDEAGLLDLAGWMPEPRSGVAIYCCGPEPLLTAVEKYCAPWPPGALRLERFRPAAAPETGGGAFEVIAARSGTRVLVMEEQTIVDALGEAGVDIPTSCGEGTCETCVTRVLEGRPDHRDELLTDEQRLAGEMLPCCSRALTSPLVLDV